MTNKINDIAELLGVTTNTIRRYEKRGYVSPKYSNSGRRLYSGSDIYRLMSIKLALECGFSHSDISAILEGNSEEVYDAYNLRIMEIEEEIERLKRLKNNLTDRRDIISESFDREDRVFKLNNNSDTYKYITFYEDNKIVCDKERIEKLNELIKRFDVEFINIYRNGESLKDRVIWKGGLAVKQTVPQSVGSKDFPDDKYIEAISPTVCVEGVFKLPCEYVNNYPKMRQKYLDFFGDMLSYMDSVGVKPAGEVFEINTNIFGQIICNRIYAPVTKAD